MSDNTYLGEESPESKDEAEGKQRNTRVAPERGVKKPGKRGRKPAKIDVKAKLERSRQSARECRARKKLRYQYLEELVASRERAIYSLRDELESLKKHCADIDKGKVPKDIRTILMTKKGRSHTLPQGSRPDTSSSPE